MLDATTIFVGSVFALAGLAKGIIGLGLPTISMGLLATAMPPVQAATILLLPSLVTNVWQTLAGPALWLVIGRLGPMIMSMCRHMDGPRPDDGHERAVWDFASRRRPGRLCRHRARRTPAFGTKGQGVCPFSGCWAITGLITAATGVFVIPAVPYLQGIGLEREELVQALGLSFTVSTLALAVNVSIEAGLRLSLASDTVVALAISCVGMRLGQSIRQRLSPAAFRRWFFAGLLLLGLYLVVRSAV
jgi:uncharacterized membrane protein YfcA